MAGDDKRQRILDAAVAVVLRYGFKRTTMDDVAREAGISRPALYLHFSNKADIYRAIVEDITARSLVGAEAALAGAGDLETRLLSAIRIGILDLVEQLMTSAHGGELLEMKGSVTPDLIENWRSTMVRLIAGAIDGEARRVKRDLAARGFSAPGLAATLLDAIEGLKHRTTSADAWQAGAVSIVRLVAMALA